MSIPEGFVEVEIEIDEENGSYKRKIVGHGHKTSCKLERDDELMDDLFEGLGTIDDSDHTDEYYVEKENLIQRLVQPMIPDSLGKPFSRHSNKVKKTLGHEV